MFGDIPDSGNFNGREILLALWIGVLAGASLLKAEMRQAVGGVIRAVLAPASAIAYAQELNEEHTSRPTFP